MHRDIFERAFSQFDNDGSGSITVSKLQALLDTTFDSTEVQEMLHEVDREGTGRISREAFFDWVDDGAAAAEPEQASGPPPPTPLKSKGQWQMLVANVIDQELQKPQGPAQTQKSGAKYQSFGDQTKMLSFPLTRKKGNSWP